MSQKTSIVDVRLASKHASATNILPRYDCSGAIALPAAWWKIIFMWLGALRIDLHVLM